MFSHLANLCAIAGVKALALPVEDLLVEVYFHFHQSSNRKERYNEFLVFTDTEPMKILKHCSTRWLSLEVSGSPAAPLASSPELLQLI